MILENLYEEVKLAMTADLHRATDFLKGAREVRAGSRKQRRLARTRQATSWKNKVDPPARW